MAAYETCRLLRSFHRFGRAARHLHHRGACERDGLAGRLSSAVQRLELYFDPTAFINPEDHWGNVGRNRLRGPRPTQFDVSLSKTTKLHESVNLEFRWEMFNLTNTPIFANPAATLAGGGTCIPSPSRQCEPATTTAYGTAGRISATIGGPRTRQGSFKLTF